ncbi:MAG TPA: aldehyde dehydrogenase family protein [Tepidisphaeraceae bacterium]|jgi:acyl-CoA reductase-like NAD-dependent aldehyde dehydrogenase|nr:aldehyde dehydrogenase family protein [Tepidisphaeraceae bacterium]
METGLFIGGSWRTGKPLDVTNKYSGDSIGSVATPSSADIEAAIISAGRGAEVMAAMPAHRRCEILLKTSALLTQRRESIARTIAAEAGKPIKQARAEVDRGATTFQLAGEEARRIHGETLALDAVPSGEGYLGFWWRRPVGIVAAITPFNFPLNLAAHKVAPAIASGNAIILKPAEQTPFTAVLLIEALLDAGLPPEAVQLLQGDGEIVGAPLVADPRVRKISFTGSAAVGRIILATAGIKKVTLELGNSSPVIVAPDADLDFVAKRCAIGAFAYAGQVCISVQRIFADRHIYEPLAERLATASKSLVVGDPLSEQTDVGPMIAEQEAHRVESWIGEARAAGARILTGGNRQGSLIHPTLLADTQPDMRVMRDEVFGPVASILAFSDFDESLRQANSTSYGLQAAVFTRDIDRALHAVRKLDFGGVIINDMPAFRVDHMPYGGNKQSGLGREGLRFAIEDMTNIQMVAIRANAPS